MYQSGRVDYKLATILFATSKHRKLNPNSETTDPKEAMNIPKFNGLYGDIGDLAPEFSKQGDLVKRFAKSCSTLNVAILRAFSMCLEIPDLDGGNEFLPNRHRYKERSGDILRLLHYPPVEKDGENRAGGHTGESVFFLFRKLTTYLMLSLRTRLWHHHTTVPKGCRWPRSIVRLLYMNTMAAILTLLRECRLRASPQEEPKWVPIPPRKNAIVVNTGDLLEFWSAGLFKSTVHRVVSVASKTSRYSIAYFCQVRHCCSILRL